MNFSCNLETLHQYLDEVILHANIPSAYMTQTTCIKGLGKWKKSCSECFKESITVMQWNIFMQFRKLQRTAYSCTSSPNNMIYKKTRCKRIMMDIILQKKTSHSERILCENLKPSHINSWFNWAVINTIQNLRLELIILHNGLWGY